MKDKPKKWDGKGPVPREVSIGDCYGPAMKIIDAAEAGKYYEKLVAHSMLFGNSRAEAESIEKQNLGYYAGYYDSETRARVEKLFCCAHPIFGAISQGEPTAEEAFKMGEESSDA